MKTSDPVEKFLHIIADNRAGKAAGIYAVCSAHPVVLEAALQQGKQDGTPVLIEATANQVNQFGGYTGMQPDEFVPYVNAIADEVGFPRANIIFGGDHLGPVCWSAEPAEPAMAKARVLIAAYVAAGFKKIHLDTSMACADDAGGMTDATVAARAAELCEVAENTATEHFGQAELVYVVGTEVPSPGGATESLDGLQVTPVQAARETLACHQAAFLARGLAAAWSRVIGLVVQPGVEFDHTSVHDYVPEATLELSELIPALPNLVFEAHSTDYQSATAYPALVAQHFAILKVGPQLTYALREALFALSGMEAELIPAKHRANLPEVCEQVMLAAPDHWEKYYPGEASLGRLYRRYSYSDRIRYYWNQPAISAAVTQLMNNLSGIAIPLPLLGQYMPVQYAAIRDGSIDPTPASLVRHQIMQVTGCYAAGCNKKS